MKRIVPVLRGLCGTLTILSSSALAQEATGPQPTAIDFAVPDDAAQSAFSFYLGIAGATTNDEDDVLMIEAGQRPTIELHDRESRRLDFAADIKRVSVDDPDVVEFGVVGDRGLRIIGRRQGITRVRVTTAPDQTVVVDVIVTRNVSELTLLLKRLYPQASIEVIPARDSLILRGTVTEAEQLTQISEIARQFTPTVLDQLKVAGTLAARTIPEGYRVVSVPINETQTLAGILCAGDRVDVLVTFQRRDEAGRMRTKTAMLMEYVEVFAPDSRPDNRDSRSLVSLLLRAEEVNAVMLAQSRGILSLAWRQPQTGAVTKLNAEVLRELDGSGSAQPVAENATVERSVKDVEARPASDLQQIRDELRALHEDVRRLIKILERRNKEESGATTQGSPAPAADGQAKDKPVGLFFMADWCGPCRKMASLVDRMKEQHGCTIRTIDIDTERDLAQIFSIHSLPTVVILDDGREVDRIIGLTTEDRLKQAFSRRGDPSAGTSQSSTGDPAWDMLGLELSPVSGNQLAALSPHRGGLEIIAVRPDSPAARQSIRAGDVLIGLHVWETTSLDNVGFVLNHAELAAFMPLKFYLVRDRETMYGTLDLGAVSAAHGTDQSEVPAAQRHIEPAGIGIQAAKALAPAILPTY